MDAHLASTGSPLASLQNQFPASSFSLLAVVLLLPLLGAFVNGVFGKRLGKQGVRLMALSAIGGSFLASLLTFLMLPRGESAEEGGRLAWNAWHWFSITGRMQQTIPIDVSFAVDGLNATMMLVVTGVGFLIHLYSSEYMKKDDGYHRFFAYLNLFCFSMLVLIMADNLALLFVGWEGVGMCSYLLIGFWFGEAKNASAGRKAFIVNRIGDFGLLVAMSMLVYYLGTLRFSSIELAAGSLTTPVKIWPIGNLSAETLPSWAAAVLIPKVPIQVYASTLVGLALFLGCAGKSAQIPLYIWLPDAMAGPTPVSALIHAATMVTAGVYLVARMGAVFILSPAAMATVAVVGAATALFAASIGLFQHDLKKVLAYSTVSQLGFMFIGVGMGAFASGFFHVFTHAFFKACLFLGAGSVIHAMHVRIHDTDRSQDMRNMGGLRKYLPITHATFLISCLSIAGVPGLAGFWSKDEILWKAFSNEIVGPKGMSSLPMWTWPTWLGQAIFWTGILAATMTAFYMFRAYFLTFHGEFKGWTIVRGWKDPHAGHGHGHDDHHDAHHDEVVKDGPAPHESPLAMTIPLMVLAAFAAFAGFLKADLIHVEPLGHLLEPVFKTAEATIHQREGAKGMEAVMLVPGILAFVAGAGAAAYVYLQNKGAQETAFAKSFPRLYKLIYDKWRIDELYEATIIGMVDALADIFQMADTWIVDGILAKLSAAVVGAAGTVLRAFQTGKVQAYSASMVIGLAGVGWFLVRPHAVTSIDDSKLKQTGEVVVSAAPGFGYTYKWEGPGVVAAKDFSAAREITIPLQPGDKKDVVLQVKNAFNGVDTQTITVARPGKKGAPQLPVAPAGDEPMPDKIVIPADKIPDLIRGHQ